MQLGHLQHHHLDQAAAANQPIGNQAATTGDDAIARVYNSQASFAWQQQGRALQQMALNARTAEQPGPAIMPLGQTLANMLVSVASMAQNQQPMPACSAMLMPAPAGGQGANAVHYYDHQARMAVPDPVHCNTPGQLPCLPYNGAPWQQPGLSPDGAAATSGERNRRNALTASQEQQSTTVAPPASAVSIAAPLRTTLDFSDARWRDGNQPTAVSANAGKIVQARGESWHVKPAADRVLASREVAAARIYGLFTHAPDYFLAENCPLFAAAMDGDKLCVASTLENYQDFGDFMMAPDSADALARHFADFQEPHLKAFKNNARQAGTIAQRLQDLRQQHPLTWWRSAVNAPSSELVAEYRPQAEQLDTLMKAQFGLLPAELRKEIQKHLVVSQLLNDWDPINAFYRNMGIVNQHHHLHVMRLDFDSSLDVGFNHLSKTNSYDIAVNQRPAVFPPLQHRFMPEDAQFSDKLPLLGEDLRNLPYADHAYTSAGDAGWAAAIRMETAYRCVLMQQQDVNPLTRIMEQVIQDEAESARGLQSPQTLLDTLNARVDRLIEQAGGLDDIHHWARINGARATAIRHNLAQALKHLQN